MEYKKLEDISDVLSGLVLSRKMAKDGDSKYKYKVLTLKSLNNGHIEKDLLDKFEAKESIKANYLTQPGDIIFRLFSPFESVLITSKESGLVIPNLFGVIREFNKEEVLPGYINALINLDLLNLNEITEKVGSVIQNILKVKNIREIKIPIIPIEQQEIIANVYREQNKLNQLYEQITKQENMKTKRIINQILEKQND